MEHCHGITLKKQPCKRPAIKGQKYCPAHINQHQPQSQPPHNPNPNLIHNPNPNPFHNPNPNLFHNPNPNHNHNHKIHRYSTHHTISQLRDTKDICF